MSKDDARKAGKTDDAAKPLSDEEGKGAVGGSMPPYSSGAENRGDDESLGFRRYRR